MSRQRTHSLDPLFDPSAIAVIGASPGTDSMSGRLIDYLDSHGFDGTIYPVNPNHDTVHGRTCYESILDTPATPSHAFVLIPAKFVEDVLEECGNAGVDYVLVGSSGFSEAGHTVREESLQELAETFDMRVVGPNCEGVIDTTVNLALSFSSVCKRDFKQGGLGIVSQSGGLGGALLQMALREGIGFSKWVSTGNEADVSLLDILEYYVESPDVDIAVAFIEGAGDGTRLRQIGRRALETETPILVIKAGDSKEGMEATASHTGRISDTGEIYDAAFEETAITRINSIQEYLDMLESFTTIPIERYPTGNGIGVVSASGGACALIADLSDRYEMDLPELPEETRETIAEKLPEYGSATNPVDATGRVVTDHQFFGRFIEDVATTENIDAVLLQLGNTGPEYIRPIRDDLYRIAAETGKPIVTSFAGGWPEPELLADLRENGIPVYPDPKPAIQALKAMSEWQTKTRSVPEPVTRATRGTMSIGSTWQDATETVREYGIDIAETASVSTIDDAIDAASRIGFPVTLKLNAPTLEHKTEIDGVKTDLRETEEVRDAAKSLLNTVTQRKIADATILVQEHVEGLEVVCGCFESEEFGPLLLVGAGGVFVELFDDNNTYIFLPASTDQIENALSTGKLGDILENYRGEARARDQLIEAIAKLGQVYVDSDIEELEVNPIIVTDERACVVDILTK